jgi:2,3-dimethylmalate lyase
MNGARQMRELLAAPGPILAPGVYDCITARLVERAGFPAAFISGGGVTASVLGYPDVGLQTMTEILNQARNIARCIDIPAIVDIDTGYGNALNMMRAVREYEAAGLAGIFFEDQTFPKRCGHFEGKKVIPAEEMVIKVKAACEARRSDDFVIIARTDSRALSGLDHAIERAVMYCEAGADMIFVETLMSVEEMRKVAKAIPKPLQANISEGGKSPIVHYQELYEMGFKVISYSGTLLRLLVRAGLDMLDLLKREGSVASAYPAKLASKAEHNDVLGLADFYHIEESLYGPLMETEGSWRKQLEGHAAQHTKTRRRIPI